MMGKGEPLVLLHGFTGSSKSWLPHMQTYKYDVACIAVDLIGHGGSDAPSNPERYRMDKCLTDLAGLLDVMGIDRAHLLGYSMGGRVALAFAATYPQRVRSLIIESAGPGLDNVDDRKARVRSDEGWAELIEQQGLESFVNHWEEQPLFTTQSALTDSARSELRTQRLRNNAQGLINSLRGLGTGSQPSYWNRLNTLTMPTLLITGAYDAKYCDIARRIATLIPDARHEIVPNVGHTIHLENPAEFDRIVLHFIRGQV
jgi:2-succinyl-6-hydroxy-2,4-cyclohexadiene-1-carboxylate synthase